MSSYQHDLDALRELQADWDSYGADPIAPGAIAAAHDLLPGLGAGRWAVLPLADGGVMLDSLAHRETLFELLITCAPDGHYGYLVHWSRGWQPLVREQGYISKTHAQALITWYERGDYGDPPDPPDETGDPG